MFSLDTLVENTQRSLSGGVSPVIIGEQHNTGMITLGTAELGATMQGRINALKNGTTGWDEAEYGMSRAEQIARLERANTPEEQERELREMTARAIRRASLDTSTGKVAVFVVGKPAWHGLGVNVESAVNSADAVRLASLDWTAVYKPYTYTDETGTLRTSKRSFVLYRSDTGAELGAVGSKTKPIQNAEGAKFLDEVIGTFGAKFHTAGAVHGGQKVWFQVALPNQTFEVVSGDTQEAFATFFNPHDGSGSAVCFPTSNRIVCNNTLRRALGEDDKGLRIRHTGDIRAKIADAQRALGLAVEGFEHYKEEAKVLARTPVDAPKYFAGVLDAVLDLTQAEMQQGAPALANRDLLAGIIANADEKEAALRKYEKAIKDGTAVLDDIMERWESDRCNVGGTRDTLWGAVNAVTEYADHSKIQSKGAKGTEHEKASRRFESALNGERDEIKQVAYTQAMALAS